MNNHVRDILSIFLLIVIQLPRFNINLLINNYLWKFLLNSKENIRETRVQIGIENCRK